jgi:hypothetical protein
MTQNTEGRLAWIAAVFAGCYVGWTGYILVHRANAFQLLFSGLGAELPIPTRIVLAACRPIVVWPVTIGMIAFLVVKEAKVERVVARVFISILVFMAAACAAVVVTEALFQPMFQLIEHIR